MMKKNYTLVIMFFVLMCSELPHINPLDPDYENDNKFIVELNNIPDTVVIYREYSIRFIEEGDDNFDYFEILDTNGNSLVDEVLLNERDKSDTTISIYFIKNYNGRIDIRGVLPNGKAQIEKSTINSINPFEIDGDTLVGLTSSNDVEIKNSSEYNYINDSLRITWNIDSNINTYYWADENKVQYTAISDSFMISARIADKYGNSLNLDTLNVKSNGYSPIIDTVIIINSEIEQGDSLRVNVKVSDVDKSNLDVLLFVNGELYDTIINTTYDTLLDIKFNKYILDTGYTKFEFQVKDNTELKSTKFTIDSVFINYSLPNPVFALDSTAIPSKFNVTIKATDNNYLPSHTYIWSYKDTVDTNNMDSIILNYDSITTDTIYLKSYNKFGNVGNSDTIILNIFETDYIIKTVNFPHEINPDEKSTFEVYVSNEIGDTIKDSIQYFWEIENKENFDSIIIDNSNLMIQVPSGEQSPFTISVYAIIKNSDTTNILTELVYLSEKPICQFSKDSLKVLLGDTALIKITASDDESIDSIFIIDSLNQIHITDSVFSYYQDSIGTKIFSGFSIDNDGNKSDTVSIVVDFFSGSPIITNTVTNIDSNIYAHDSIKIKVSAYSGDNLSTIASYLWDLTGDGKFDTSTNCDSITFTMIEAFEDTISISCINSIGDTADISKTIELKVKSGAPTVNNVEVDKNDVFIKEEILLNIAIDDPKGFISEFKIDYDNDSIADTTIVIDSVNSWSGNVKYSYNTPGSYLVNVWATDDKDNVSEIVQLSDTINVDGGIPVISNLTVDRNSLYMKESLTLSVNVTDPDGIITEFAIDTSNDTIADIIVNNLNTSNWAGNKQITFDVPSQYFINVWAIDNYSNLSKITRLSDTINVNIGLPIINSITPDTVDLNDIYTFIISASDIDTGGSIIKYEWSLDSNTFITLSDSTFTQSFQDSGMYYIYSKVTDNNNNVSPIYKDSVYVSLNAPIFDSLVNSDTIWINDSSEYKFFFHDQNDSIIHLSVSWGDGNISEIGINGKDSITLKHSYMNSNDTGYNVIATVMDNDSLTHTGSYIVNVFRGIPEVTIEAIDTTDGNIFVMDNRTYSINATDVNGYIRDIFVSWDGDDIADDTITISSDIKTIDTNFVYAYDTTKYGNNTIKVWATDDDTVVSSKIDTTFHVRLGAPVLHADTVDTIWVIVDSGTGENYPIHINSIDTNGTLERFYWHEAAIFDTTSGSCVKTVDSTRQRNISALEMHAGFNMWIYGKDNDGLMRGGQFIIYADSVPPLPSLTHSASGNNMIIGWSGKDTRDGDATEYQILCDLNNPPTTVISEFKAGSEYDSGAAVLKDYSFTFTPSLGTGTYYYQIKAKDTRGSVTSTDGADNFTYIQP